ncbi:MAG: hypothetical protein DRI77_11135 [Chloroflexi bacterium]|nr:MAG: hypothetical protein B6I34_04505 [Anaerolineaceae bacterium 4572_32.1]RLC94233.1 MAG: hypothetical protein DRI77_11135 [Chloroflexota bacterium]
MFKAGDAIVHPIRGVGVVMHIEERQWRGSSEQYYRIELLGRPTTSFLTIPIKVAEKMGLRRVIPLSELKQVWRVLCANSNALPDDRNKRYEVIEERLHGGDIFQVAEVVRDMAWRKQQEGKITTRGKQMYDEGMGLLAGEIAVTRGIALTDAETQIRERLLKAMSPPAAM